jgi:hypothetical protein
MVASSRHRHVAADRSRPDEDAEVFCRDNGLQLSQVSDHAWLVRTQDTSSDLHGLVGCIEERGQRFELMQIGSNFRWSTFDSLQDALEHLLVNAHISVVDAHVPLVDPRAWSTIQ